MIRFLLRTAINLVDALLALLLAAWLIDGFHLSAGGLLTAVAVFTVAQAILSPFVFNMARQYASAVLGGIGIVSTLLALWITSLFSGGIRIEGVVAWLVAPLLVWIVTALGGWILGIFIIDRWWTKRAARAKLA